MKVGLILPLFSGRPDRVLAFARRAESLGYDGLFAFDHFFPPGAPADRASMEAYTTLSAVAAATERIAVGTLVTRASLRPAGLLAKLVLALEDVSNGRTIIGIGTGDELSRLEHETFGVAYLGAAERREHLRETVRALRTLIDGAPWLGGARVGPVEGPLLPPRARPDGPTIWIGGLSDAVVRIAATEADGWNGWGISLSEFERKRGLLCREAGERPVEATWAGVVVVGRDEDEAGRMLDRRARAGVIGSDVWAGGVDAFARWLWTLRAAGATWAILLPGGADDRLELIAEVLPEVQGPA